MIRITSKKDGFRRCGLAHGKEPVEYPNDRFSSAQLKQLKAEPMLLVEVVEEQKQSADELIAMIAQAESPGALNALLPDNEKRKTVLKAAEDRRLAFMAAKNIS